MKYYTLENMTWIIGRVIQDAMDNYNRDKTLRYKRLIKKPRRQWSHEQKVWVNDHIDAKEFIDTDRLEDFLITYGFNDTMASYIRRKVNGFNSNKAPDPATLDRRLDANLCL